VPPVAATEFKSKFRWDVDVGHYLWSGAGASRPMNVNWGKKGATSSTPIVINDVVTVEPGAGAAVGQVKLPERRTSCRPSISTPRGSVTHRGSLTPRGTDAQRSSIVTDGPPAAFTPRGGEFVPALNTLESVAVLNHDMSNSELTMSANV